jgi:hypothetical protein
MMLDIADALPLILEGAGRRTELQIPVMLALLFFRRGLWHRSDGYRNRTHSDNACGVLSVIEMFLQQSGEKRGGFAA